MPPAGSEELAGRSPPSWKVSPPPVYLLKLLASVSMFLSNGSISTSLLNQVCFFSSFLTFPVFK